MSIFQLPGDREGTTLIRGVRFVDGKSGDVSVSEDTRAYFNQTGVKEVKPSKPEPAPKK